MRVTAYFTPKSRSSISRMIEKTSVFELMWLLITDWLRNDYFIVFYVSIFWLSLVFLFFCSHLFYRSLQQRSSAMPSVNHWAACRWESLLIPCSQRQRKDLRTSHTLREFSGVLIQSHSPFSALYCMHISYHSFTAFLRDFDQTTHIGFGIRMPSWSRQVFRFGLDFACTFSNVYIAVRS